MMAVVRAFCDVFADCSLWNGTPADLMLVGIRGEPSRATRETVARPWTQSALERGCASLDSNRRNRSAQHLWPMHHGLLVRRLEPWR